MGILDSIASGIGHVAKAVGGKTLNATDAIFGGIGMAGAHVGEKAWQGAKYGAKKTFTKKNAYRAGEFTGGFAEQTAEYASDLGRGVTSWADHMYSFDPEKGLKLTKIGAATLLGAGIIQGVSSGTQAYMGDRVGTVDPQKYTATPKIEKEDYTLDNYGATGDLVFALHNNRHG